MRVRRVAEAVVFAPLGAIATLAARLARRGPAAEAEAAEPVAAPTPSPGTTEAPAAGELPIEGYDHLAASQVIDRLDGLTRRELADVEAYERRHKHRQVVLGRLTQLQP